jgi:EAL domain-containing protein (putative c-di-GMP-specific phosphodiesterase class I)
LELASCTGEGVNSAQGYLLDRPTPAAELDFNRGYGDRLAERDTPALAGEELQVA